MFYDKTTATRSTKSSSLILFWARRLWADVTSILGIRCVLQKQRCSAQEQWNSTWSQGQRGFPEFVVEMVSFICNACGQTVRKTQVEKHYQNDCRNCNVLSCIDCGKDFHGDEYVGHTSCISEAEKYQGKLYKPKDKSNKGEHKQQEWLKVIIRNLNFEFYPRTVNCVI